MTSSNVHGVRDSFPDVEEERRLTAGEWVKGDDYTKLMREGGRWTRVTASGRKQTLEVNGVWVGSEMTDKVGVVYGMLYNFVVTDSSDTAYDPYALETKTKSLEEAMVWADSQV